MKKFLFILAAAAFCFAACDKEGGNDTPSDGSGIKCFKMSVMMVGKPHVIEEYYPTFSNGKLTKLVEKTYNNATWSEDGVPEGLFQSGEMVYNFEWDESSKTISGTFEEKGYNEESSKLEALESRAISGAFDANHNFTRLKAGYMENTYQYDGSQQLLKNEMNGYSISFTWADGNISGETSYGGSNYLFEYGEANSSPKQGNLAMAIFVEADPFAVLGFCGVPPKQLPVKADIVTTGYSEHYVITYEKDSAGRVVKMTKSPAEADQYSHIQVYEIEY